MEAARGSPLKSNRFASLSSVIVYSRGLSDHFHIPVKLKGVHRSKNIVAMVDSGATATFIHRKFVDICTRKLDEPIPLFNIDGTENREGFITHVAVLDMIIGLHSEKVVFTITDIDPEDVIIGIDWLRKHNPDVDWTKGSLRLSRCPESCCTNDEVPVVMLKPMSDMGVRPTAQKQRRKHRKTHIRSNRTSTDEVPSLMDDPDDIFDINVEEDLIDAWSQGIKLDGAPQLFVMAGFTYSQQLAEQEHLKKPKRSFEEMVPEQYREFTKVFSKPASERLPERKVYDHAIELVPDAKMFHSRVYPIPPNEQAALDKFLKENAEKRYIRESKSPMASPFFFIKKKDGELRPVQDYCRLNEITIKNRYPIPLISQLVDTLKNAKHLTKLDICWGYNF